MLINKKTKQHIFDELRNRNIDLSGKLEENDFLARVIDLSKLPSDDPRYGDMKADHWQHRINNDDWDDYWIFGDERTNLLGNDTLFKKFICELMHPAVREAEEAKTLKDMINYYLKKDGYQIVEDEEYYEPGVSTYKFVEINPTQIEKNFKTTDNFVHEAYEKADKRLRDEDYGGAITSARTLLEYAIKDIYYQITGDNLKKINDLQDGFKKIQKLLKLDYDKTTDQNKKKLLRSFITIVNALAPLSNNLGDRHATKSTTYRNSAQFCTDSTKIFVNFLYGRMHDIHGTYPSLYDKLIKILDSDMRVKNRDELLAIKEIAKIMKYCDGYVSSLLIRRLISDFEISSFYKSDMFLAFLRLFYPHIRKQDLLSLVNKYGNNDQTAGFKEFIADLYKDRKKLFSKKIINTILECRYLKTDIFN